MKNYLTTAFYDTLDYTEFIRGLQVSLSQVKPSGIFVGDNLFTINRNLGFLDDVSFMGAFEKNTVNSDEKKQELERSIIWRTHVIAWAAHNCLRLEGDFVECACYKGTTAKILCEYLDFNKTGKHYYLYDLFEHDDGMDHHSMYDHGPQLYEMVKQRFVEYPNVHVTKGSVPEVLHEISPARIAFLHLDLNSVAAEIGALELLFDRMVPGGVLILDDYGWLVYKDQKTAEDAFFAERGYKVLELPTGQGMLIK